MSHYETKIDENQFEKHESQNNAKDVKEDVSSSESITLKDSRNLPVSPEESDGSSGEWKLAKSLRNSRTSLTLNERFKKVKVRDVKSESTAPVKGKPNVPEEVRRRLNLPSLQELRLRDKQKNFHKMSDEEKIQFFREKNVLKYPMYRLNFTGKGMDPQDLAYCIKYRKMCTAMENAFVEAEGLPESQAQLLQRKAVEIRAEMKRENMKYLGKAKSLQGYKKDFFKPLLVGDFINYKTMEPTKAWYVYDSLSLEKVPKEKQDEFYVQRVKLRREMDELMDLRPLERPWTAFCKAHLEELYGKDFDEIARSPWPWHCRRFKVHDYWYFIPPWDLTPIDRAIKLVPDARFPMLPITDQKGRRMYITDSMKLKRMERTYYGIFCDDGYDTAMCPSAEHVCFSWSGKSNYNYRNWVENGDEDSEDWTPLWLRPVQGTDRKENKLVLYKDDFIPSQVSVSQIIKEEVQLTSDQIIVSEDVSEKEEEKDDLPKQEIKAFSAPLGEDEESSSKESDERKSDNDLQKQKIRERRRLRVQRQREKKKQALLAKQATGLPEQQANVEVCKVEEIVDRLEEAEKEGKYSEAIAEILEGNSDAETMATETVTLPTDQPRDEVPEVFPAILVVGEYQCKESSVLEIGDSSGLGNNCFFDTMRQLLDIVDDPQSIREKMRKYAENIAHKEYQSLQDDLMFETDDLNIAAHYFMREICVHVKDSPSHDYLVIPTVDVNCERIHIQLYNCHYRPLWPKNHFQELKARKYFEALEEAPSEKSICSDITKSLLVNEVKQRFSSKKYLSGEVTPIDDWELVILPSQVGDTLPLLFDPKYTKEKPFDHMIGDTSLYHFLRSHVARRTYKRCRQHFHFSEWLFKIIFPGNLKGSSMIRTKKSCLYSCKWFYQDCQWHENFVSDTLVERRKAFKHSFESEHNNSNFWISLVELVNDPFFQQRQIYGGYARIKPMPLTLPRAELGEVRQTCPVCGYVAYSKDHMSVHMNREHVTRCYACHECDKEYDTKAELEIHMMEHENEVVQTSSDSDLPELYYTCDKCSKCFRGSIQYSAHYEACRAKGKNRERVEAEKAAVASSLYNMLSSQITSIMEGVAERWRDKKSLLSKLSRCLINISMAIINLVMNPTVFVGMTTVVTICNEVRSEIESFDDKLLECLRTSLTNVINRRVLPTGQAAPTREEDQTVAEESLTTTFFEIIRSLLRFGKVDAMLLKARQMRIEAAVRSIGIIKDVGMWFITWIARLWTMAQIYFFGGASEDFNEAMETINYEKITDWMRDVDSFEMKKLSSGKLQSFSAQVAADSEMQALLYELRSKGLVFERALSRIHTGESRSLSSLVTRYNQRISKWVTAVEASLANSKPKHSPLVIYLHGGAGVGKSLAIDHLASALFAARGEVYDPIIDKFQKNRSEEFWDGYHGQKVVLFDDFLQTKDPNTNVVEVGTFIDLASRNPCHLKMANCQSKSGVYFTTPVIFLTSNVEPTPQILGDHIQSFPAFCRRIDLEVEVKSTKTFTNENFSKDAYRFNIRKWRSSEFHHDGGHFVTVCDQLLKWDKFVEYLIKTWAVKERKEVKLDNLSDTVAGTADYYKKLFDEIYNYKSKPEAQAGSDGIPDPFDEIRDELDDEGPKEDEDSLNLRNFRRCTVQGCNNVFFGDAQDRMTAFLIHNINFSMSEDAIGMAHRMQASKVRALVPTPAKYVTTIKLLPKTLSDRISKIRTVFEEPTCFGSPWTLDVINDAGWTEGVELVSGHILQDSRFKQNTWFKWRWPWSPVSDRIKYGVNACEVAFSRMADAAVETKNVIKDAISSWERARLKIVKMFYIGTLIAAIGTALAFLVQWLKKIPLLDIFKATGAHTEAKVLRQYQETDDEGGPQEESRGLSGSDMTNARRRKKIKQVRIEATDDIIVVSPLMPRHPKRSFRLPKLGETPHIYVASHGNQVVLTSSDGREYVYQQDGWRIDPNELGLEIESFLVESESKVDRLALVENINARGPKMEASRDQVASQAISLATSNLAIVRNPETGRKVTGIFLCDRILLIPQHIMSGVVDPLKTILRVTTNRYVNLEVDLSKLWSIVDANKDVMLVDVGDRIPKYASIINKFIKATDVDWDDVDGYLIVPKSDSVGECVAHISEKQLKHIVALDSQSYHAGNETITIRRAISYEGDTVAGECGSLIVRFDPRKNQKFMGIHVAGETGVGYGSLLSQEYLNKLIIKRVEAQSGVEEYEFGDLVDQSVFSIDPLPKITLYGRIEKKEAPSAPRISKIMKSPLYGMLMEPKTKPAHLRPFETEEGEKVDPLKKALGKLECNQIILPEDVVKCCAESMRLKYASMTINRDLGSRGLLTDEQSVNGIEGDKWIRPLNMHTSPGYPYVLAGGKDIYLLGEEKKIMSDLLLKQFHRREEEALKGNVLQAVIVDCLKDERLPNAKVDIGKTRIFSNCPLDLNLVMRKYFLKFLAHMMDHHVDGESSVGLNVHSSDWECLYKRLKSRGQHWIGGDYEAWDKRTPYQLAIALLPIIEDFYSKFSDYQASHAILRKTLIDQVFTCTRLAIGEDPVLYRVHQSMPSGIPLTAVYNSLINALLFRVVYTLLAQEQGISITRAVNSYDRYVSFAAYGDDHIVRVSEVVFPWFNMRSISRKMKEFGIGYTAPDKSEYMPEELEESKLTYLKRSFRQSMGRVDAPLPIENVIDILSWVHAQNFQEAVEATKMAVQSVFLELTHHPESVFNQWYHDIIMACAIRGINVPVCLYRDALKMRLESEIDLTCVDF